jgi:hypothetical protein
MVKLIIDLILTKHNIPKDLYQSKKIMTGLGMEYEKIDVCEENCMLFWKEHKDNSHPADSEAWQTLDRFDPEFARDPRSVRLGLSTDGFQPHNNDSHSYSCWLVFVMPYNLPPDKCVK